MITDVKNEDSVACLLNFKAGQLALFAREPLVVRYLGRHPEHSFDLSCVCARIPNNKPKCGIGEWARYCPVSRFWKRELEGIGSDAFRGGGFIQ